MRVPIGQLYCVLPATASHIVHTCQGFEKSDSIDLFFSGGDDPEIYREYKRQLAPESSPIISHYLA